MRHFCNKEIKMKPFSETVEARANRDPEFRKALKEKIQVEASKANLIKVELTGKLPV